MIKDGRLYLVYCKWPSRENWEILKWGIPVALSDRHGVPGWINSSGFKIRTDNCVFVEFYEFETVISKIRK